MGIRLKSAVHLGREPPINNKLISVANEDPKWP